VEAFCLFPLASPFSDFGAELVSLRQVRFKPTRTSGTTRETNDGIRSQIHEDGNVAKKEEKEQPAREKANHLS
jgi:hypothetical protein